MHRLFLTLLIFSFVSIKSHGQNSVSGGYADLGYNKLEVTNANNTDGSPYFQKKNCLGSIQLSSGIIHEGLNLKLNLQENKIVVSIFDGVETIITTPVSKVILKCTDQKNGSTFLSGLPAIDKQNQRSLYQLLDSGSLLLLKYVDVRYKDTKDYNGNYFTRRTYYQTPHYYIFTSGKKLIKISLNEDQLLSALVDKRKTLLDLILKDNIKIKKEADLIHLISLYNQTVSAKS